MAIGQSTDLFDAVQPSLASLPPGTAAPVQWEELDRETHEGSLRFNENETFKLEIELGRTRLTHPEASQLRKGTVVPLDGSALAPVDFHIDGKLIGRGEPLWLNGKLAFRVLELFDGQERPECG
jgi:flagellar motor switch/type III secretory pathway protein FliN